MATMSIGKATLSASIMKRLLPCLALVLFAGVPFVPGQQQPAPAKLLIAFSSYRDRPKHPNIYFYEHDGVANGKIVGQVGTPRTIASADAQPSLSHDGQFCFFTHEVENKTSRIYCWDLKQQKLVDLANINNSPNAQMGPSVSGDGNRIAFTAWNRPGANGWHVYLFDKASTKFTDLPGLNDPVAADRMAALSGNGRFLAFASNRKGGAGLTDLYLYDCDEKKLLATPELNSKLSELEPSLNHDGNLIAFASERPGGLGGRDICLFNRTLGKLVPLPGLNSADHEFSPALSPDGRFIAFVSERLEGEGQRDIYLYDRQTSKLLPTPGLNSKTEDFDPCVIVLK